MLNKYSDSDKNTIFTDALCDFLMNVNIIDN